jgi:hypothetical protein
MNSIDKRRMRDIDQNNDIIKGIKRRKKRKFLLTLLILVLIVGIGILVKSRLLGRQENTEEIITISTLEKIVNISELSTFQAVYNGIAKVMNEKNPDQLDYYVSYEAKVYAGLDIEKVKITKDEDIKKITVTIPEIKISDINVDEASLDYIFLNKKANTSTVSEQAYKACKEDAAEESTKEAAIYELADQNARNIIEALINPFIGQLDSEYELEIN